MLRHLLRTISFAALWLAGLLLAATITTVYAQDERPPIYVADVEGVISPPVVNYLARVLDEAEAENSPLVIIQLDTPGGLETSMREIIQSILDTPVPVAVYVTPSGARAASAGLFILAASHIAAMAPSTNTGSAHPVGLGGDTDETMTSKVVNDAAALIRSLAVRRDRNIDWLEQAVRESVSVTDSEALELNVIDLIAPSLDSLIEQIDGMTVETSAGEITISVAGAPRREANMNFAEQFLHVILDPNLAFILLSIGSIGIIAELYNPGVLIPGITGVISLILAFFALGNLPTNWAGVGLIVLAVILFVAELNTDATGVLTVGALVAFVLGAFILFRPFEAGSPALPDLRVSPLLLGVTTVLIAGFFFVIIRQVLQARTSPLLTGQEQFAGQIAQVRRELQPEGRVWFQGQSWFARSLTGEEVAAGRDVRIVAREDLTLIVEPLEVAPSSSE